MYDVLIGGDPDSLLLGMFVGYFIIGGVFFKFSSNLRSMSEHLLPESIFDLTTPSLSLAAAVKGDKKENYGSVADSVLPLDPKDLPRYHGLEVTNITLRTHRDYSL